MRSHRTALMILLAIHFLFFLQALSDFIQSIYAFGLLVTAFTPQLAAVLLLFSPVALLFMRREPSRRWLMVLGVVAVLGRLLEPLLDPGGRLVACGISVGAFMLLWPLMLASGSRYGADAPATQPAVGWPAAWGLLLAVTLSIFFRTAGSSLDISEVGITQVIAWGMAGLAAWMAWRYEVGKEESEPPSAPSEVKEAPNGEDSHEVRRLASLRSLAATPQVERNTSHPTPNASEAAHASTARVVGLCIGLASVIVLLYFAFVSPTVIARWTGGSYLGILGLLLLTYSLFTGLRLPERLSRRAILIWNLLFVVSLVLTIFPHQIAFPGNEQAYPVEVPAAVPDALWLMMILSPILVVDFLVYVKQLLVSEPTPRQLGGAFSLAALFFLVMVFLHVFTTIYDYAKPIGPLFRDRFWLVYLIAGVVLVLPSLWHHFADVRMEKPGPLAIYAGAAGGLLLVAAWLLAWVQPEISSARGPYATPGMLRVMTYNIQQGFDKVGNQALPGQLEAIRHVQPDVLGLEESDTARVANGNVDAVRYFANNLGMYSYYGPPTTVGTFGIALLSKYPIQNPRTFYMYSTGEQTACIEAKITANGKTYNVFVTHLGNDGPMIQLQNVLSRVDDLPNVILVGDFNFDPSTPQYALATKSLADAWLLRWPGGRQLTGPGAEGRIDQIFVSPGTQVTEAEYVPNPSSDHPYLYAVLR